MASVTYQQIAKDAGPPELVAAILERSPRFGVPPHCCNADDYRDRTKNVTIPARGWLVLHHVAGKRRRSTLVTGDGSDLAFKHRCFRQYSRSVLKSGKGVGMKETLKVANGNGRRRQRPK